MMINDCDLRGGERKNRPSSSSLLLLTHRGMGGGEKTEEEEATPTHQAPPFSSPPPIPPSPIGHKSSDAQRTEKRGGGRQSCQADPSKRGIWMHSCASIFRRLPALLLKSGQQTQWQK